MSETSDKINPTDPLILAKEAARRKRNWPDSSYISFPAMLQGARFLLFFLHFFLLFFLPPWNTSSLMCGCIGLLMIRQDSRFRSGTPQRVLTTQVFRWQCSSTRASCAPRTNPSRKWGLYTSTRWLAEAVVRAVRQWESFRVWVRVRLYSPWKTTMTSGQDVSEYLDTFGLVKSYFFKFFEKMKLKKNRKKIEKKNVLVLRRPGGWGDFPVCRIAC